MDRHDDVKTFDDIEMYIKLQNDVNIAAQYVKHCQEILDMLAEFSKMWDGR